GGTPVLVFGEASGKSEDAIELIWDGGRLSLPLSFEGQGLGDTVWLLQGSRLITDWESRYSRSDAPPAIEKRKQARIATQLRDLTKAYGLASREMPMVAVVKRVGDRVGELPTTQVVPVGMAQGTAFESYFGNSLNRYHRVFSCAVESPSRFDMAESVD